MKWWGWGREDFSFPIEDKPRLLPWIAKKLGVATSAHRPPVPRHAVNLPATKADASLIAQLTELLSSERVSVDDDCRLVHALGKSYPDLYRVRRGEVQRAPDVVVFPVCHDEVQDVLYFAAESGVTVVPFGGGTNIVGGINPTLEDDRPAICLALSGMNRLLSVDPVSHMATLEGGTLGPRVEELLAAEGFSLGHFPDSFEFSTLGGWLATRSAGMQSDAFGKIEDMVLALKMATPSGTLVTRPRPRAATGPELDQMVVGSEGILGVITEATVAVHPVPAKKEHHGVLFRNFVDGVEAMQECVRRGVHPTIFRLSDEGETELSFQMKRPPTGMKKRVRKVLERLLTARGYQQPALMIVGFEGTPDHVRRTKAATFRVLKRHGGFSLGASVGASWSKDKYNLPYLRDLVMDFGVLVDVAETSVSWSGVLPLHDAVKEAVFRLFEELGVTGYLGCHVSHTYETGACLYFTFAAPEPDVDDDLERYYLLKRTVTEVFLENGGALSHHHAIGVEHRPWMEDEVSPVGLLALRGLKDALDPSGVMNPGKLLPPDFGDGQGIDLQDLLG